VKLRFYLSVYRGKAGSTTEQTRRTIGSNDYHED
jgi:hypothetical protein